MGDGKCDTEVCDNGLKLREIFHADVQFKDPVEWFDYLGVLLGLHLQLDFGELDVVGLDVQSHAPYTKLVPFLQGFEGDRISIEAYDTTTVPLSDFCKSIDKESVVVAVYGELDDDSVSRTYCRFE